MENLETIQYLVATVERLTKEGTTYKVELEHTTQRRVAWLFEKQTRIFDDMKVKHQEIYNSK